MGDGMTLRDWQAFHAFLAWDAGDYDAGSDLEHAPACSVCFRPGARHHGSLMLDGATIALRLCQICDLLVTEDISFGPELFRFYRGTRYV